MNFSSSKLVPLHCTFPSVLVFCCSRPVAFHTRSRVQSQCLRSAFVSGCHRLCASATLPGILIYGIFGGAENDSTFEMQSRCDMRLGFGNLRVWVLWNTTRCKCIGNCLYINFTSSCTQAHKALSIIIICSNEYWCHDDPTIARRPTALAWINMRHRTNERTNERIAHICA